MNTQTLAFQDLYPPASVPAVAVCAVLVGAVIFAAIADRVRDLDSSAWARLGFTGRVPVAARSGDCWYAWMLMRCPRR